MSNKIGWWDKTFNYVRGCLNSCEFCYARRFNNRTFEILYLKEINFRLKKNINDENELLWLNMKNFKPIFMYSQFSKPLPKKPMRIFIDSMSDIAYWKPEWMRKVIEKIGEYPQHKFLFLTNNMMVYDNYNFSKNCWLGTTIISQGRMNSFASGIFETTFDDKYKIFVSIEPIQMAIKLYVNFDWVIIGAESGNRKNRIIAKKEWIEEIREFCQLNKIPYFEKNNLKNIVNRELIQEYPK